MRSEPPSPLAGSYTFVIGINCVNYKITPTPGGGGDVIKLREIESLFFPQTTVLPHPALSKGEGVTAWAAQVLLWRGFR